jgi:NADPH-dependent 2,4-dienoyl-CoA reductase/sulfur reductase-like enzyme/nitrite reductase/ring-hydroxylating ferredoxin subunit
MEHRVASGDELPEGRLLEVDAGGKKVLLLRQDGVLRAYGARCPHYDAPLAHGLLHDGRLVCPWHQGTFDARTGDLLEPPPLAGLTALAVRVDADGDVLVDRPDDAPRQRTMPMATRADDDPRTFCVVGGGAAGAAAVEALRQHGFTGRIVLVDREGRRPYDRPNLSKDYLAGTAVADWLPLRPASFYERYGIELLTAEVRELDAATRRLELGDGTVLTPDAVLIATGGLARTLDVAGADLPGVHTLRSWSDCDAVVASLEGAAQAVVVGASFIAMEGAASLRERGLEVTVVAPEAVPLERQLGAAIGGFLRRRHEEHGVRFLLGHTVARFAGDEGVREVALDDGSRLTAGVVLVGVGVRPATDFVANAAVNADGSLDVDAELRLNDRGVWAAGDVARYPESHVGDRVRIEHWRLAEQLGRAAAASMAGHGGPFTAVPAFWTQQFGLRLPFVGVAGAWDDTVVLGDLPGGDFTVAFARGGRLVAAAGTRDLDLAAFVELMRTDHLPTPERLRAAGDGALTGLL